MEAWWLLCPSSGEGTPNDEVLPDRMERLDLPQFLDACQAGMLLLLDGVPRLANTALLELLGLQPGESLEELFSKSLGPDQCAHLRALLRSPVDPPDERLLLQRGDGHGQREVSMRLRTLGHCEQGRVQLASFDDVTDMQLSVQALRDHARRLRLLSRQVLEVQEQERRHLARELHDEIGQQLTMVKMAVERARADCDQPAAQLLDSAVTQLAELTRQVRSLSLDLRPSMLDDLGLSAALRWYANRTASLGSLQLSLNLAPDFPRMSQEAETVFFRVGQEAMNNMLKHAAAQRLELLLGADARKLWLELRDDGRGFDLAVQQQRIAAGAAAGLLGMQERAALAGARLDIESAPGRGCRLRLELRRRRAIRQQ